MFKVKYLQVKNNAFTLLYCILSQIKKEWHMKAILEKSEKFTTMKISSIGKDTLLVEMIEPGRRVFSVTMVQEIMELMDLIVSAESEYPDLHKAVLIAGKIDSGLFNLGGDLKLFSEIANSDVETIEKVTLMYAKAAHRWNHLYEENIITVSVVNGDAYGGGLEVAIGAGYSIAEKGYLGGFPEVTLGFIPNAGAVEILARKLGVDKAISIITEPKIFEFEKLHEIGVFDSIVEQGTGVRAGLQRINFERKSQVAFNTLKKIKTRLHPLTEESFIATALTWVELLKALTPFHHKKIAKIVAIQAKKY